MLAVSAPNTEALEAAQEIRANRHGPNRVMEIQRARMWDREPSSWTRYERMLAGEVLSLAARLAAAEDARADDEVERRRRERRVSSGGDNE